MFDHSLTSPPKENWLVLQMRMLPLLLYSYARLEANFVTGSALDNEPFLASILDPTHHQCEEGRI